jgi:hypothetical protein
MADPSFQSMASIDPRGMAGFGTKLGTLYEDKISLGFKVFFLSMILICTGVGNDVSGIITI